MKQPIFNPAVFFRAKYLLLISFLWIVSNLSAQKNNVIFFNDSTLQFEVADKLPPHNQELFIQGKMKDGYKIVTVTVQCGINSYTRKAEISNNIWRAAIGSFTPGTNVNFSIEITKKLTENEVQSISGLIRNATFRFRDEANTSNKSYNPDEFKRLFVNSIIESIKDVSKEYISIEGISLDSLLTEYIYASFDIEEILEIVNNLDNINEIINGNYFYNSVRDKSNPKNVYNQLIQNINSKNNFTDELVAVVLDSLSKGVDSKQKEIYEKSKDDFTEKYRAFLTGIGRLDSIILALNQGSTRLLKTERFITTLKLNQEIRGIDSYIGFDLGMTYIPKLAITPFFVSVSPYFTCINPEEDVKLNIHDLKTYMKTFSPTLGFGINTDNNQVHPIYFVGVGCRINKVVRFALGKSYYLPANATEYEWSWSFNASISTFYISDFINSILSIQNQFKK